MMETPEMETNKWNAVIVGTIAFAAIVVMSQLFSCNAAYEAELTSRACVEKLSEIAEREQMAAR
jgi:hypothetical protein